MKYQFAFKTKATTPGNPLMIKGGTLDDRFDAKSLESGRSYPWHKPVHSVRYPAEEALSFPDELWLNTGERKLAFDVRLDFHGFIFSERIYRALGEELQSTFKIAQLNVVNRKGVSLTSQKMFYGKPIAPQSVVNEEATERVVASVQTLYGPVEVRQIRDLTLKEALTEELIYPTDLDDCILLSEPLAEKFIELKITGVDLVSHEEFCQRYNDRSNFS